MKTEDELLNRITVRSEVFGGKPIVRDMRIAVEHVLGMLAAGDTAEEILEEYPSLEAGGHPGVPAVRPPLAGRGTGA